MSVIYATHSSSSMAATVLLLGLLMASLEITGAQVGVCYGGLGNNLPPKNEVVDLYKSQNIKRMRLYGADQETLQNLKGSGIELMLDILNDQLQSIASDPSAANAWVQNNVLAYVPSVSFKYIVVGNEVNPAITNSAQYAQYVLPAMKNIYNSITSASLRDQIKVSTAIDAQVLGVTYPPSDGAFRDDVRKFLEPIIGFLVENQTPVLANIYPYFIYFYNQKDITLPYALFTQPSANPDGYQNLFDALLDAMYSALEKAGGPSLKIVVSESGWPSAGNTSASPENAQTYYSNLIKHVKGGTPKKPREPIETYLFAMFDENLKPGNEEERHFGLFLPNKQSKYQINFT